MRVGVLGPFEVLGPAGPVTVGPKERALLAALVVRAPSVVTSSQLIDDLWGEDPPMSAAKTVQTYVSHLRRVLPEGTIETRGAGYRVAIRADDIDGAMFERLVRAGHRLLGEGHTHDAAHELDAALALWRGEPLAELHRHGFAALEAARLSELRLSAVEDRAEAGLALGEARRLVVDLQQLVRAHPLRERLWGLLMRALHEAGRQAEALATFQQARTALIEQAGIEPGAELRAIERRLLQPHVTDGGPGPGASTAADPPPFPASLRDDRPLHGRAAELLELERWEGRLLLVSGEPGIGKSRLLAEIAHRQQEAGAVVLHGRCHEELVVPYHPFVDAIRPVVARLRDDDLPQPLRRLFPGRTSAVSGAERGSADVDIERYHLFEAVASVIALAGHGRGVLLVIDDLHWADQATLLLLRHVLRDEESGVRVVAAYRDTDVVPGGPLARTLVDLRATSAPSSLELGGLDDTAVRAILGEQLGDEPDEHLVQRVRADTRGNPLFARLVAAHLAAGAAGPIPDGVREVISRRVERLPDDTRTLLSVAAVIGQEFDLTTLCEAAALSPTAGIDRLEPALDARLVDEAAGQIDRFRFGHALMQATLYEAVRPSRRARLHLAVAEALERLGDAPPSELARHFVAAASVGAGERARRHATAAGEAALAQLAYHEAVTWLEEALGLLGDLDEARAERGQVLAVLVDGLFRAGRLDDARARADELIELARSLADPELLARAALGPAGRRVLTLATDDTGVAVLDEALDALGPDHPGLQSRILSRRALTGALFMPSDELERRARRALELARGSTDPAVLSEAAAMVPARLSPWVDAAAAQDDTEHLLAQAVGAGADDAISNALLGLMISALQRGDGRAARQRSAEYHDVVDRLRVPYYQAMSQLVEAMWASMEARFDDAERALEVSMGFGQHTPDDALSSTTASAALMIVIRWLKGTLPGFMPVLDGVIAASPDVHGIRLARALALNQAGERDAATRETLAVVESLGECIPIDGRWLGGVLMMAQVSAVLELPEVGAWLYPQVAPVRDRMAMAGPYFFGGSYELHLGLLALAARWWDVAVDHLRIGVAQHDELGARSYAVLGRNALAKALRGAGATAEAEEVGAEAVTEATRVGLALT